MLYELVNSITLEKIGGPILVMSNLNFPDLCCCFETSNILKVAYRDDDRCIITTKTFYLGGGEFTSVSIERTCVGREEAQTLPLSLMNFYKNL